MIDHTLPANVGNVRNASRRWWTRPLPIVLGALALRLAWALLVPVEPMSDSVVYDQFARSLTAGKGYAFAAGNLTAYWPVGTSAVVAALYLMFGDHLAVVAGFNVLLGAAIVWLTWSVARRVAGDSTAALAGWFVACWPELIEFTSVVASELLFIGLLLAALQTWLVDRLPALGRAVLFGALIAGATYVRPTAWPLLLLLPLVGCAFDRNRRRLLMTFVVSTLVALLLWAPWTARNYALFDRFVLIAANGGVNLWMGNNEASSGGYMPLPDDRLSNEAERDQSYGRLAVEFIAHHPLAYLTLCGRRLIATYDRESIGVAWNEDGLSRRWGHGVLMPIKALSAAYWWLMLVAGMVGAFGAATETRRARHRISLWPLGLIASFLAVVPVMTVGGDRYHMPLDPFLAIFAAMAVGRWLARRSERAQRAQKAD